MPARLSMRDELVNQGVVNHGLESGPADFSGPQGSNGGAAHTQQVTAHQRIVLCVPANTCDLTQRLLKGQCFEACCTGFAGQIAS